MNLLTNRIKETDCADINRDEKLLTLVEETPEHNDFPEVQKITKTEYESTITPIHKESAKYQYTKDNNQTLLYKEYDLICYEELNIDEIHLNSL